MVAVGQPSRDRVMFAAQAGDRQAAQWGIERMRIALDPYMFRGVPLTELPGLVADLGYSRVELSPRDDFLPFFVHPRADREQIAAFRKAPSPAG